MPLWVNSFPLLLSTFKSNQFNYFRDSIEFSISRSALQKHSYSNDRNFLKNLGSLLQKTFLRRSPSSLPLWKQKLTMFFTTYTYMQIQIENIIFDTYNAREPESRGQLKICFASGACKGNIFVSTRFVFLLFPCMFVAATCADTIFLVLVGQIHYYFRHNSRQHSSKNEKSWEKNEPHWRWFLRISDKI